LNIFHSSNNELADKAIAFIKDYENSDNIAVKTSGSTGQPKVFNVEKARFICSAKRTCDFFSLKKGDKSFLCISPEHIGGKMMIIRSKIRDMDLHIGNLSSFPFEKKEKYDFAAFVPLQINRIIEKDIDYLKSIKNIIIGGGVLNQKTEEILVRNGVNAYATFGMTETLSHIALRKIGQPEYQLLNEVEISTDGDNRLIIHDAKTTGLKELSTNDIVELTSNRSFIWKGRFDNVINSGGVKISPEEIEEKLQKLIDFPFFISKEKDAYLGEKVILIIESKEEKEEINFKQVLSKYEIPKSVYFIEKFILTDTKKINRNKTLSLLQFEG
jgi:O-succinylbenzoic acid--CoA ligase